MNSSISGKKIRRIPKNLDECTHTDATVSHLRTLAEHLDVWGSILFKILIAVGVLATIDEAITTSQTMTDDTPFTVLIVTIVSSLIQWGIYAIVEHCAFRVLALLASSLAIITENTTISANVALMQASQNGQVDEVSTPAPVNHTQTPPTVTNKAPKENTSDGSIWICSACGTQNLPETNICRACKKEK